MVTGPDADVAVVGAGPAGVAMALAASGRGKRVLLIDKAPAARDKPCGEGLLPLGAQLLRELGVDLGAAGYPALEGVRYRLTDGRGVSGFFRGASGPGYGVRRSRFNGHLLEVAAASAGVELRLGTTVVGVNAGPDRVRIDTPRGELTARSLVAADGLVSPVAKMLGWARPARPPHRYALIGHFKSPGPRQRGICVTVLPGREVYSAPAGDEELLVAVLGTRDTLVDGGSGVDASYRNAAESAHPELMGATCTSVRGAGPFRRRPATVARGRVFLLGDAAGFVDPLTGDAMAAGIAAAVELTRLLEADPHAAAARYRRWHGRQMRRRRLVTALALLITGGSGHASRALAGIERRPSALDAMLEVNGGLRQLHQVGIRDWAALAGI